MSKKMLRETEVRAKDTLESLDFFSYMHDSRVWKERE